MSDLIWLVVLLALCVLFVWSLNDSWERAERKANVELAHAILDAAYLSYHYTAPSGTCDPAKCRQPRHPKTAPKLV